MKPILTAAPPFLQNVSMQSIHTCLVSLWKLLSLRIIDEDVKGTLQNSKHKRTTFIFLYPMCESLVAALTKSMAALTRSATSLMISKLLLSSHLGRLEWFTVFYRIFTTKNIQRSRMADTIFCSYICLIRLCHCSVSHPILQLREKVNFYAFHLILLNQLGPGQFIRNSHTAGFLYFKYFTFLMCSRDFVVLLSRYKHVCIFVVLQRISLMSKRRNLNFTLKRLMKSLKVSKTPG